MLYQILRNDRFMAGADVEDVSSFSGSIVECSWNPEEQSWVCMRTRPDKATPNDINTYTKVSAPSPSIVRAAQSSVFLLKRSCCL